MSTHWTRSPAGLAAALAVGGGVGLGARLLKHLMEVRKPVRPAKPPEQAVVPVEVTPEEALELERRGTDVQLKTAAGWFEGPQSAVGGAVRGMAATGMALGAYKLVDHLIESKRRRELQEDIQRIRGRIENVLTDNPAAEDVPLHATMKAAEEQFMKTAVLGVLDATIPPWLSVPAGAAALIAALTSFRQVRDENRYGQRIGDLRRALINEQLAGQGAPRLQLAPVVDAAKMKEALRAEADKDGNSKVTGYIPRPADGGSPSSEAVSKVDYSDRLERLRKRRNPDGTSTNAWDIANRAPKREDEPVPAGSPASQAF